MGPLLGPVRVRPRRPHRVRLQRSLVLFVAAARRAGASCIRRSASRCRRCATTALRADGDRHVRCRARLVAVYTIAAAHRRRRRRAARADHRLRLARRARLPPQRRRAAGAGDRRRRLALRRRRRRGRLQAAARPASRPGRRSTGTSGSASSWCVLVLVGRDRLVAAVDLVRRAARRGRARAMTSLADALGRGSQALRRHHRHRRRLARRSSAARGMR